MTASADVFSGILGEGDNKKVALIRKITAKTQQGKIQWHKNVQGSFATAAGALVMNFVEAVGGLLSPPRWVLFTVRDSAGTEIVKVENSSNRQAMPMPSPPPSPHNALLEAMLNAPSPLVAAVNDLYRVVRTEAKGDVERAIDLLDRI